MKRLLIIGTIASSLALLYFVIGVIFLMPYVNREGARDNFVSFGIAISVSLIALITCIVLLIIKRGSK